MDSNKVQLALGSWVAALAVGTLAGTLLWVLGGWSFLQGAFVGGVVFVVVGVLISFVMTRPMPGPNEVTLTTPEVPSAAPVKAEPPKAAPPKADSPQGEIPAVASAPTVAKVKPTARLEGEEELAARKGSWKYEKEPTAEPTPAPEAAPEAGERPAVMMDAPEGGAADDLKKITGVGPKLEKTLNDLGIYHFDQVAKLTKTDIAWIDERLRFKGRIERDDWMSQAKALAEGKGGS
ncbi:MAG: hypothetical protein AAGF27_11175 [Pseudomonadota bacterium]